MFSRQGTVFTFAGPCEEINDRMNKMYRIKTGTAELGSVRFSWPFVLTAFPGCPQLRRSEIFVEPTAPCNLFYSPAAFVGVH